jgi:flavin reductase (DIM6/NTAB) family NADH-FMN oxidoreductase RutF
MILQLDQYSANATYFLMTQTLLPRPIAWVLSENETGNYNLAPFSYFNAICSEPPLIMLSIGKKPDGTEKDTRRNIKQRKHFTVHIADARSLDALNQSSATLDKNESELEQLQLTTTGFEGAALPRLSACKIAYACTLHAIHEIGTLPQAVIYGEVKSIYIDDSIVTSNDKGRIKVHADRLQPISRLGADEYMQAGEVISIKRPY